MNIDLFFTFILAFLKHLPSHKIIKERILLKYIKRMNSEVSELSNAINVKPGANEKNVIFVFYQFDSST